MSARTSRPGLRERVKGEGEEDKTGPPLLLAERWDNEQDLAGWWMSEKLDGVRAYWDGRTLISRLGNRFHAPDWFLEGLPEVPLDGELWIGRKAFQRTVGIVRRQDKTELWKEVTFVVFDAPALDAPFEDRLAFVRDHAERCRPPHFRAHEHDRCAGLEHLRAELARVEALGGEGLMMRQPGSRYEAGRSTTLLKIKSFRDAEAQVRGHQPGAGRHKGRLGALLVELPDGTRFSVGTGFSDAERSAPPAIGSVITFRYQELSDGGVPRFPSYVGVRDEVAWGAGGSVRDRWSPPRRTQHPQMRTAVGRAPVRADRGGFPEVLGGRPEWPGGDGPLRPHRHRRTVPGEVTGERGSRPGSRGRPDRREGGQGLPRGRTGIVQDGEVHGQTIIVEIRIERKEPSNFQREDALMASLTFKPLVVPIREDEQGAIRVGETRVLLDLVIHAFQNGASPEAIVESYDALSLPGVYAVLSYYLRHPDIIDDYLAGVKRRRRQSGRGSRRPNPRVRTFVPC